MIELFRGKQDCCGCGACEQACPKNAIRMTEDEYGFCYPVIDEDKCIQCGKCQRVCAFQKIKETNIPHNTYAAVSKDKEALKKSASGGIFHAMASKVLEQGGCVFGAAFGEDWKVHHVMADNRKELQRLQGSKYVQSATEDTYEAAKLQLQKGTPVIYSGTPCQIAGLKAYLGREYSNLILVDIVCHGVPSNKMFREYLHSLEQKEGASLTEFTFRDKNVGWGINGRAVFQKDNKTTSRVLWQSASSYLYYFVQGWLYRESCYQCPYTCEHRPGDITLCDFWGIEKSHPEYLGKDGMDERMGISAVIVNTTKGQELLENLQEHIELKPTSYEAVAAGNAQLRKPAEKGRRESVLECYAQGGWNAVASRYNESIGVRRYTSQIKSLMPASLKRWLKARKRAD